MRVAYLGPAGTFSEDALRAATAGAGYEPLPRPTVFDAIQAVAEGEADRALVPFENSIEGSVRSTLDSLAFDAPEVEIAGEHDHSIANALIARSELDLRSVEVVLSHPQANAQCAPFLREHLPQAEARAAASTADAVREVSETDRPWAALGAASAAEIYGCVVIRDGVDDEDGNVTRFVWVAPAGTVEQSGEGPWRTTLIFSELGEDHPGALVDALTVFSAGGVNLTRIESRPQRKELGRYMFFVDLEGAAADPAVSGAIAGLRDKAESVRVLGSYPVATAGIPGA